VVAEPRAAGGALVDGRPGGLVVTGAAAAGGEPWMLKPVSWADYEQAARPASTIAAAAPALAEHGTVRRTAAAWPPPETRPARAANECIRDLLGIAAARGRGR